MIFSKRTRLSSEAWCDPTGNAVMVILKYQGQMQSIKNYKASCCFISLDFCNQLGKIYFCQEASLQALQQISIPIWLKLCRVTFLFLMVPEVILYTLVGVQPEVCHIFHPDLRRCAFTVPLWKRVRAHIFHVDWRACAFIQALYTRTGA